MGMLFTLGTYLFAKRSPVTGAARLFDFWGLFDTYNHSATPTDADAMALYADWRTVGEHLWEAYEYIGTEEMNNSESRIERTAAS